MLATKGKKALTLFFPWQYHGLAYPVKLSRWLKLRIAALFLGWGEPLVCVRTGWWRWARTKTGSKNTKSECATATEWILTVAHVSFVKGLVSRESWAWSLRTFGESTVFHQRKRLTLIYEVCYGMLCCKKFGQSELYEYTAAVYACSTLRLRLSICSYCQGGAHSHLRWWASRLSNPKEPMPLPRIRSPVTVLLMLEGFAATLGSSKGHDHKNPT